MTTPGGAPNLPKGALTLDNLADKTQDMSPTAMKTRAGERFPSTFSNSTGGNPLAALTPFNILTKIHGNTNSLIANADPADIQGPEDLPNLVEEFIEGLPVIGQFFDLLEAIVGDYDGDSAILLEVQQIFAPIRKVLQLLTGITSGFPTLDQAGGLKAFAGIDLTADNPIVEYVDNVTQFVADSILGQTAADIGNLLGLFTDLDLTSDAPIRDYIDNITQFISDSILGQHDANLANLYSTVIAAFSGIGDEIADAFFGENSVLGAGLDTAKAAMEAIREQLLDHTKQLQAITSNGVAQGNSGANVTIDFSDYPDGALPSIFTVTYFGPGSSQVGIVKGNSCWRTVNNDGNKQANIVYNVAPTLTDFQIIRGTMAQAPMDPNSGGTPYIYSLGHVDDPTNVQNAVWFRAYSVGFFTWKADIGCIKAGVFYTWQTGIPLGWNLNIYMMVGVNGNSQRHQLWAGTTLVKDYTETAGQTGGLSNLTATVGGVTVPCRYWGARSEMTTGPNTRTPGQIAGCSTSDNAPPTTVGSSARYFRQSSTGAGTISVGSTPGAFPANTFTTEDRQSGDIGYTPATNEFTVSREGSYVVDFGLENSAGQVNGTITRCGFLYRPAPIAGVTQAQVVIRPGNDIPVQTASFQTHYSHFAMVYLRAGDSIAPAAANSSTGLNPKGDSGGYSTWFSIAVANVSMN